MSVDATPDHGGGTPRRPPVVRATARTTVVALRGIGAIGPIPRMLRDKGGTAEDRGAILDGLRAGLEPFRSPDGIRVPARINLFSAVRP